MFIIFLQVTDYRPNAIESLTIYGKGKVLPSTKKEFSFLTWNIGYGGLGRELDFFYDGGKQVMPDEANFRKYMKGIIKNISAHDTTDFIFIQEVDTLAKRTYFMNEVTEITRALPGNCYMFAKNYDCRFVPVPVKKPMGRVVSGLMTISPFQPVEAERHRFESQFSWPKSLVILKRCFLVTRYALENGKELVIINTHNSAFDEGGVLRKKELAMLHEYILKEYCKGNYIVTGGDWNSNPRGFNPTLIRTGDPAYRVEPSIDENFLPGWEFVFDAIRPSNRNVDMPYAKGKTKTTIIDFFVVSPNIEVKSVKTLVDDFENSDHHPVLMQISLKKES